MSFTTQNRRPSVIRQHGFEVQISQGGQPEAENIGGIKLGAEDSGGGDKLAKAQSTSGEAIAPTHTELVATSTTSVVKAHHKMDVVAECVSLFGGSQSPGDVDNIPKVQSTSAVDSVPAHTDLDATSPTPEEKDQEKIQAKRNLVIKNFLLDSVPAHTDLDATSPTPEEKDQEKIQAKRNLVIKNFLLALRQDELYYATKIIEEIVLKSKKMVRFNVPDVNSQDLQLQTEAPGFGTDESEGERSDKLEMEEKQSTRSVHNSTSTNPKVKKSDIFSDKSDISKINTSGEKDNFKVPIDYVNSKEIESLPIDYVNSKKIESTPIDYVTSKEIELPPSEIDTDNVSTAITDPTVTIPKNTMSISSPNFDTLQLKRYKCEQCGQEFNQKKQLKTHIKIHNSEIKFPCSGCPQVYFQKSSLVLHMKKCKIGAADITNTVTYTCDICSKVFARVSAFNVHKRTHSGEKPYSCKSCGQTFTHSNSKNRHESGCVQPGPETIDQFLSPDDEQYSPAMQCSPTWTEMPNVDCQSQRSCTLPPSRSNNRPPSGSYAPEPPGSHTSQPPVSYPPQPPGLYAPQPPGLYAPQPPGSYPPQAPGSYAPQPPGSYAPQPPGSYAPPPSGSNIPSPSGSYVPPPSGSYVPPPSESNMSPPPQSTPALNMPQQWSQPSHLHHQQTQMEFQQYQQWTGGHGGQPDGWGYGWGGYNYQ